jgi:hypothetical protein
MAGPVSATIPVHQPNRSGAKAARRYQVEAHVDAGPRDAGYEVEPEARGRGQVPFDDRGKGIDVVEVGIIVSEEEGQERLELRMIKVSVIKKANNHTKPTAVARNMSEDALMRQLKCCIHGFRSRRRGKVALPGLTRKNRSTSTSKKSVGNLLQGSS